MGILVINGLLHQKNLLFLQVVGMLVLHIRPQKEILRKLPFFEDMRMMAHVIPLLLCQKENGY
ncbi:hypothetical protein IX84_22235 [Phaeodactylibacter xiamenensis]|uniref:Uncharacterized protein n=1 Tax=Phaeodactylibacter xiamenensis TaxID=1524460 RepID=A0A098S3A1_9BACT|nr:hypothetical protein IX84_22235 [Phaeodactylibacter xiamenensis]